MGPGSGGFTIHNFVPDIGVSIIVMLIWFAVTAALGYMAFRRREMVS
jgi:ABC-type transport system involved in multi-copper enzyme maturation permease subunit